MDKRVIVGLLGLTVIGGYYIYMNSKPPEVTAQDYGSTGVISGSYQAPPSSPASGETNVFNYNIAFPDMPAPQINNAIPADLGLFKTESAAKNTGSSTSGGTSSSGSSVVKSDAPYMALKPQYRDIFKPNTLTDNVYSRAAAANNAPAQPVSRYSADINSPNFAGPKNTGAVSKPTTSTIQTIGSLFGVLNPFK